MSTIHQIVERSGGAYTHDEVFMLDCGFVKHLSLMWFESDQFQERLAKRREEQSILKDKK